MKPGRWLAGEEGPDGGAMAGANWNHRNSAPRREIGNGRYREGRELTVSRMGAFSAFGTAPDAVSTAAGLWREKRRAGEGVAGQNNAKTRNGEYLRTQGGPAVLRVALASAFALGRGRFSPAAVVSFERRSSKGRREALGWGFIGRLCAEKRKESGRDWSPAMCG